MDEIICPYCGAKYDPIFWPNVDDGYSTLKPRCTNCKNRFLVVAETLVKYTVEKIKED